MKKKKIITSVSFAVALLLFVSFFISAFVRTNYFNSEQHEITVSGKDLFKNEVKKEGITINVSARSSTWGKVFDLYDEGLTENNYQAYTYDFYISNFTSDEVKTFNFKFIFENDAFISSAWNGAIEFHQFKNGNELVETIYDMRDYNPLGFKLEKYKFDGETFIRMHKGDYIVYKPSTAGNASEMPIKAHEGTTPGIIMYVEIGETIENSTLVLNYTLYRLITSDVLFWISLVGFLVWTIVLIVFIIIYLQIRKYNLRHERDNEIINESIETFTGFIDAKDPYTNGHSKRVAIYTKLIAEKMGFQGEELDHIYYVALLHDCGKIGVPDNVLGKPGRLTDEEFEIIKSHAARGGEILQIFKSLENADEGAHYHHERYDGRGYPEGLKGEEIPLIARMICVADSFDAMNSSRVYRKRLSKDYIISELENNKGTQFDPKIADIMLNLIKDGKVKIEE